MTLPRSPLAFVAVTVVNATVVPGVWGLYSLLRTGRGASSLSSGHQASYVSRAVAFYRQIAGIPTNQNPPVVRYSEANLTAVQCRSRERWLLSANGPG